MTTSYAYNSSGQLASVTVAGEEVAAYGYDAAGFRQWASTADAGRMNYVHSGLGELLERHQSKKSGASLDEDLQRRITYRHDALGRVVTARDADRSSHWEYDDAGNGVGLLSRRCRMPTTNATGCGSGATYDASYAYNTEARLSSMTTDIVAGGTTRTYEQEYGYDGDGRLTTMTYPSGLTARYEYNARGHLSRMLDDGDSSQLHAYVDRDARGNATRESLRNGALVTRTFEAASGRQMRQDVRLAGKLRHDALYGWRTDELLEERSIRGVLDDNTTTGYREESFSHDGLGRLTEARARMESGTRTLTTAYDALGNLTSKTSSVASDVDVTGYDYTGALNAVQRAAVDGVRHRYDYDATGRMTGAVECPMGTCPSAARARSASGRHIEWDARGLATKVVVGDGLTDTAPAARETFRYGPGEARFERVSEWREDDATESVRTIYVGAYEQTLFESDAEVISVERTRLMGGVVHVKTTPAMGAATESFEYRHVDHLGSASVISDDVSAPLAVLGHDPFGERRRADWSRQLTDEESAELSGRRTVRGFTGHEHLDRTGLVHMNGRLYDPQLGRFLSPDPHVTNPAMGQDWNRYSYVSNSPMSYSDPTGYVRAGPGCDSVTVFCASDDAGGGFARTRQGFVHQGQVAFTIPYVPEFFEFDGTGPAEEPMKPGEVSVHVGERGGGGHRYHIRGAICDSRSNPQCDEAWTVVVRGHVQKNDVPFINDDEGTGERVLWGDNPILHSEYYSGTRVSVNETRKGHILHPLDPNASPGTVTHSVYFDEHGILRYDIVGKGARSGLSAAASNALGVLTFQHSVRSVVDRFGDPPHTTPPPGLPDPSTPWLVPYNGPY